MMIIRSFPRMFVGLSPELSVIRLGWIGVERHRIVGPYPRFVQHAAPVRHQCGVIACGRDQTALHKRYAPPRMDQLFDQGRRVGSTLLAYIGTAFFSETFDSGLDRNEIGRGSCRERVCT